MCLLGTSATNRPIVPAPDDRLVWNICLNANWQAKQSTTRKPAPVPFCPPQIPHDLTWYRTRAFAVGGRRLTDWAMVRPPKFFPCQDSEEASLKANISYSAITTQDKTIKYEFDCPRLYNWWRASRIRQAVRVCIFPFPSPKLCVNASFVFRNGECWLLGGGGGYENTYWILDVIF
jgi:hypothetical protein